MMKEQVITQVISISRRGEQKYFQVKLPRDTQRIIGVETGLRIQNLPYYWFAVQPELSLSLKRNVLVGTLQLQANSSPNVFYSKEVFERDNNISAGELKLFPANINMEKRRIAFRVGEPPDGNSFSDFTCLTHGRKMEEDPLSICNCTVVNGQLKDRLGEYTNTDAAYKVTLYIWIERKTIEYK